MSISENQITLAVLFILSKDSGFDSFDSDVGFVSTVEERYEDVKKHNDPAFAKFSEEKVRKDGAKSMALAVKKTILQTSTRLLKNAALKGEAIDCDVLDNECWLGTSHGGMVRMGNADESILQAKVQRCRDNVTKQQLSLDEIIEMTRKFQPGFDKGKNIGEILESMGLVYKIPKVA